MAQQVIAARDFALRLTFNDIGAPITLTTGANFSANISGSTDDIGAFSTDEPIATDNGGTTYDLQFSLQEAEAIRIKDALAAAQTAVGKEPVAQIRQIIEDATITAIWYKRRDVPATVTTETYTFCTGVEESDAVERRGTETLKTWHFRARGMVRTTEPL